MAAQNLSGAGFMRALLPPELSRDAGNWRALSEQERGEGVVEVVDSTAGQFQTLASSAAGACQSLASSHAGGHRQAHLLAMAEGAVVVYTH
jgi:hypothetical protein